MITADTTHTFIRVEVLVVNILRDIAFRILQKEGLFVDALIKGVATIVNNVSSGSILRWTFNCKMLPWSKFGRLKACTLQSQRDR